MARGWGFCPFAQLEILSRRQEHMTSRLFTGRLPERQATTLLMPQDFMAATMFRVPSDIMVVGPERKRRKLT